MLAVTCNLNSISYSEQYIPHAANGAQAMGSRLPNIVANAWRAPLTGSSSYPNSLFPPTYSRAGAGWQELAGRWSPNTSTKRRSRATPIPVGAPPSHLVPVLATGCSAKKKKPRAAGLLCYAWPVSCHVSISSCSVVSSTLQ